MGGGPRVTKTRRRPLNAEETWFKCYKFYDRNMEKMVAVAAANPVRTDQSSGGGVHWVAYQIFVPLINDYAEQPWPQDERVYIVAQLLEWIKQRRWKPCKEPDCHCNDDFLAKVELCAYYHPDIAQELALAFYDTIVKGNLVSEYSPVDAYDKLVSLLLGVYCLDDSESKTEGHRALTDITTLLQTMTGPCMADTLESTLDALIAVLFMTKRFTKKDFPWDRCVEALHLLLGQAGADLHEAILHKLQGQVKVYLSQNTHMMPCKCSTPRIIQALHPLLGLSPVESMAYTSWFHLPRQHEEDVEHVLAQSPPGTRAIMHHHMKELTRQPLTPWSALMLIYNGQYFLTKEEHLHSMGAVLTHQPTSLDIPVEAILRAWRNMAPYLLHPQDWRQLLVLGGDASSPSGQGGDDSTKNLEAVTVLLQQGISAASLPACCPGHDLIRQLEASGLSSMQGLLYLGEGDMEGAQTALAHSRDLIEGLHKPEDDTSLYDHDQDETILTLLRFFAAWDHHHHEEGTSTVPEPSSMSWIQDSLIAKGVCTPQRLEHLVDIFSFRQRAERGLPSGKGHGRRRKKKRQRRRQSAISSPQEGGDTGGATTRTGEADGRLKDVECHHGEPCGQQEVPGTIPPPAAAEGGGECSICLELLLLSEEDGKAVLSCHHLFHEQCLHDWYEKCKSKGFRPSCPLCRQSFSITCSSSGHHGPQVPTHHHFH